MMTPMDKEVMLRNNLEINIQMGLFDVKAKVTAPAMPPTASAGRIFIPINPQAVAVENATADDVITLLRRQCIGASLLRVASH